MLTFTWLGHLASPACHTQDITFTIRLPSAALTQPDAVAIFEERFHKTLEDVYFECAQLLSRPN